MIDRDTVKRFYRRLNHQPYGLTELVAIDKDRRKGIRATGFFDNENAFINACALLNPTCHIYAGRNPRPFSFSFSSSINKMNSILKLRASDFHITTLTAFSLDIDPIRPKNQPATAPQRESALRFASLLQRFLGGYVDDSGNGVYLWIPFATPIHLTHSNAGEIKAKCRQWQMKIVKSFSPSEFGLKVDGCFDFSRIKRIIGSFNHKAKRLSSIHTEGKPSDKIRDEILALPILHSEKKQTIASTQIHDIPKKLPSRFLQLLDEDSQLRELWHNPDPFNDTSCHDWALGKRCVDMGIDDPKMLAVILMKNPFGKYSRDGRKGYVEVTAKKLIRNEN